MLAAITKQRTWGIFSLLARDDAEDDGDNTNPNPTPDSNPDTDNPPA